ncbi:MAG: hypothetical protein P0S95_05910 [Rhabdochlamydiaceae bacterium]|nr:hypothetical protein [Candidatus Amphrikana amoebophyrae]
MGTESTMAILVKHIESSSALFNRIVACASAAVLVAKLFPPIVNPIFNLLGSIFHGCSLEEHRAYWSQSEHKFALDPIRLSFKNQIFEKVKENGLGKGIFFQLVVGDKILPPSKMFTKDIGIESSIAQQLKSIDVSSNMNIKLLQTIKTEAGADLYQTRFVRQSSFIRVKRNVYDEPVITINFTFIAALSLIKLWDPDSFISTRIPNGRILCDHYS